MSARILCVDDEPRVLDGLELQLGMDHEVSTATSGSEGLRILSEEGAFDLVISDMRMPGMDGATFLSAVRSQAPDTMRVLLTGQSDMESAVRAVNEGSIFRFLTKPCPPDVLLGTVEAATELRRLRTAERDLLERTLRGCVEVLAEVLGVAAPSAFQHAHRVRTLVERLAPAMGVPSDIRWQLEVAAMLTGLGSIAVPVELLERASAGDALEPDERAMLDRVPEIGASLLAKVPRLEGAAELVGAARPSLEPTNDPSTHALQVGLWVAAQTASGMSWTRACVRVERHLGGEVAKHLGDEPSAASGEERTVAASALHAGMHICQDVLTGDGRCIVRAGTDVTRALAARLRNFAENVGLQEPIRVRL